MAARDPWRWIRDVLAHREGLPVPWNFPFSPPAQAMLERHYGTRDLVGFLDSPIRMVGPKGKKPLYADPAVYGPTIIGDLVDMGLDILHPVQPVAMDPRELKREFGRR